MVSILQTSALLGSASSVLGNNEVPSIFNQQDATLATITTNLLNAEFNITQPAVTTSFSQELINFITDNLDEGAAESLLADIAAIDKFNGVVSESESSGSTAAAELFGNQGNILDLLA
ncbi:MAG: hypothetical protein P8P30_10820 [Rickettsiales bacterium]|nr:hypothetical protein [Rickettsiales bacterium]